MMNIDKTMDDAWLTFSEWAEREYKAGFVAGYSGNVAPDEERFTKVFIWGYSAGYEFSQIRDQQNTH